MSESAAQDRHSCEIVHDDDCVCGICEDFFEEHDMVDGPLGHPEAT